MTKKTNEQLDKCISSINVRPKSIIVLLFSLLLIIKCCNGIQRLNNNDDDDDDCPVYCTCYIWYQLIWASCAGKQLVNVHTGVSEMVQALDLSNNSLSKLSDYEFVIIGIKRLKYLNLSGNAISEISLFAFAQLNELTILDLSQNHFNYLNSDTFVDNNQLRIVKIDGNNFHYGVPALNNARITELSLSRCQISHLQLGVFDGLEQLEKLDISYNIMIELDITILKALSSLRTLTMTQNPWLCNNAMNVLKSYLKSKLISYNSSICEEQRRRINNAIVKFEKIKLQSSKNEHLKNINNKFNSLPMNINNGNKSWKNSTIASPTNNKNNSNCTDIYKSSTIILLLPVWFFVAGLIIGCAVGMIAIYLWLARQQTDHVSQRQFSLLDNMSIQSDETLPTYCEVMLHSNLYPHI